jgi:hypothetical protein
VSGSGGIASVKEIILKDLPAKYVDVAPGVISLAYQVQGKNCEEHAVKFFIAEDGHAAPVITKWSDRTLLRVVFRLE